MNQYFLPAEDVNDEKSTIVKMFFNSGDKVKQGDIIYSFETTKALIDVETEFEGFIQYYVSEGEEVNIGSLVCEIFETMAPISVKRKTQVIQKQKKAKPTKKALIFAQKYGLEIEALGLEGIIKEKDLTPFIKDEGQITQIDRCLMLDREDKFVQYLLVDESFKNRSSEQKIEEYKTNGHKIGKNVKISNGAVLIGNKIEIKDNVSIGSNTYIESPELRISANTTIGNDCEFVASKVWIGKYNNISNKVYIDISGGRSSDSNFITGRGCLIAYETYINVCRQVKLGKNVALSPKSMIYTHSYWQSVLDGYPTSFGPVTIEDNSWVGSSAQILPNITVRTGSIIISNSLVTGEVKPFTMVGGVPAKLIKEGLKNKISKTNKEKMIKELFFELSGWLYSHHCDIEKVNDKLIFISYDNNKKSCMLYDNTVGSVKQKDAIDIIILINLTDSLPKTVKTIFDIKNESVQGPVDRIESMIIEFFRRKGIRFYEQ